MYLKRLDLDATHDRAVADALFLGSPDYELETFGRLPNTEMAQPISGRFPEHCPPEHRLTFAAFDHDEPIGFAQVALHTPVSSSASLLLLLVPRHGRRQHIGCEIVERLSRQARRWPGIANWQIAVVDTNREGLAFWRHCGFRSTNTGVPTPGFPHRLITLVRSVKGRPVCQHHGAPEDAAAVNAQNLFARLR